jgi:hypothetical protein
LLTLQVQIAYFAFFAAVFFAVWFKPAIAVAVLLCTFAIEQAAQSMSGFFYVNGTLTNIMCGLVGLWAVFIRFIRGESVFKPFTRDMALFVAIFGFMGFSTFWSLERNATSMFVGYLPSLIAYGMLMPLLINKVDDVKWAFRMFLIIAVLVAPVFLFYADWRGRSVVLQQGTAIGSLIGDSANPLAVASFAGYLAMIGLTAYIRPGPNKLWFEVLRWSLVAAAVFLCIRTSSRGQFAAIFIAGGTFMILSRRWQSLGQAVGLVMAMGLFGFLAMYATEYAQSIDSTRFKVSGFWEAWSQSRASGAFVLLEVWANAGPMAWIFGLGSSASYAVPGLFFYCHVVMAEALGEMGLIGLVLIWLVPIFFAMNYKRAFLRLRDLPQERALIAGLGAMFLFDVILSFKQGAIMGSENTFAFAIMLSRTVANLESEERLYEEQDQAYYDEMAMQEVLDNAPEEYVDEEVGSDEYALAER